MYNNGYIPRQKDTIGIKLANKLMRFVACSVNAEVTYSEEDNG